MDSIHFLPLRILSHPRSRRLPWAALVAAWVLAGAGAAMFLATYSIPIGPRWGPRWLLGLGGVMFAPMGAVVASRQPRNLIGWIYCAMACLCSAQFFAQEYAVLAVFGRPGWLPAGEWAAWLQSWIWVPIVALYLVYVPLLLPQGRLPSPRWRPVAGLAFLATLLLMVAIAAQPGRLINFYPVFNPLGAGGEPQTWQHLQNAGFLAMVLAVVGLGGLAVITWLMMFKPF